jgi:hypothetical protein
MSDCSHLLAAGKRGGAMFTVDVKFLFRLLFSSVRCFMHVPVNFFISSKHVCFHQVFDQD